VAPNKTNKTNHLLDAQVSQVGPDIPGWAERGVLVHAAEGVDNGLFPVRQLVVPAEDQVGKGIDDLHLARDGNVSLA
jgi:hypothetical protein